MSDTLIATLITVAVVTGLLLWTPLLHGCAHCQRKLRARRTPYARTSQSRVRPIR